MTTEAKTGRHQMSERTGERGEDEEQRTVRLNRPVKAAENFGGRLGVGL